MKVSAVLILIFISINGRAQADTMTQDCNPGWEFGYLKYICPSCTLLPQKLDPKDISRVSVTATLDSFYHSEVNLCESILGDSFVYIKIASKARCTTSISEAGYYTSEGYLKEICLNSTLGIDLTSIIYKRDKNGREDSSISYNDWGQLGQSGYDRSYYNEKGKLTMLIFYSKLWDHLDTVHFKYDRKGRRTEKTAQGILGGLQTIQTSYSKDGHKSVTKLYSEGSDHGSFMDSTYYTATHHVARMVTPESRGDALYITQYKYDEQDRMKAISYFKSDEPQKILEAYNFHYVDKSRVDYIEHFTPKAKSILRYQYKK